MTPKRKRLRLASVLQNEVWSCAKLLCSGQSYMFRMTSPSNQELAAHGGNADWTCQLNELQSQLEQLVEAAGGGSDPNGVNAQACLKAFNHLRAVAPIQLRSHAQTEQALWLANRALEKANADLAASNSLIYQIDMVKVKR